MPWQHFFWPHSSMSPGGCWWCVSQWPQQLSSIRWWQSSSWSLSCLPSETHSPWLDISKGLIPLYKSSPCGTFVLCQLLYCNRALLSSVEIDPQVVCTAGGCDCLQWSHVKVTPRYGSIDGRWDAYTYVVSAGRRRKWSWDLKQLFCFD